MCWSADDANWPRTGRRLFANASLDWGRQGRGGWCGLVPEAGSADVSLDRGSGLHSHCRDTQSVGWTAASSLFRHSNPRGLRAGGECTRRVQILGREGEPQAPCRLTTCPEMLAQSLSYLMGGSDRRPAAAHPRFDQATGYPKKFPPAGKPAFASRTKFPRAVPSSTAFRPNGPRHCAGRNGDPGRVPVASPPVFRSPSGTRWMRA